MTAVSTIALRTRNSVIATSSSTRVKPRSRSVPSARSPSRPSTHRWSPQVRCGALGAPDSHPNGAVRVIRGRAGSMRNWNRGERRAQQEPRGRCTATGRRIGNLPRPRTRPSWRCNPDRLGVRERSWPRIGSATGVVPVSASSSRCRRTSEAGVIARMTEPDVAAEAPLVDDLQRAMMSDGDDLNEALGRIRSSGRVERLAPRSARKRSVYCR